MFSSEAKNVNSFVVKKFEEVNVTERKADEA